MKEAAWRLFERQPGFKRKTREEFEEELTRKVRNTPGNNRGEREKMMQKWSSEMRRVVQLEERRHEARERMKMEQERFQLPNSTNMGENTGTEDSRPDAAPRTREMSSTVPQRQITGCIMESQGHDTFRFARRREDALRNRHTGQRVTNSGNRTVSESFDVYTATPIPSMTGTASPQTTTH